MALTQYFVAATLDGFIADPEDDLGWLLQLDDARFDPDGVGDANPYEQFIGDVSVLAMGSTTYSWIREHLSGPWPYGDRPTYVFTHRQHEPMPGANLTFTEAPVTEVHAAMTRDAGDGNIWLVGGGDLVGQFLDHDLLDEIWLTLAPVTLGAGAPLLPRRHTAPMRLVSAVAAPNGTYAHLRYQVRR
jgi:dihydrofolate reductase